MAHPRLYQTAESGVILDRLRELMRQVALAGGQGDQGRAFLAEYSFSKEFQIQSRSSEAPFTGVGHWPVKRRRLR
jgi:hypothetical protein